MSGHLGIDYYLPFVGLLALGLYLLFVAAWILLAWRDRGIAWPLAAFFMIVGAGNALDAWAALLSDGATRGALRGVTKVMSMVDGIPLLLAAVAAARWPRRSLVAAGAALAALVVIVRWWSLGTPVLRVNVPRVGEFGYFGYWFAALYIILYGGAVVILALHHRRASPGPGKAQAQALLLTVGVLAISRLALLRLDLFALRPLEYTGNSLAKNLLWAGALLVAMWAATAFLAGRPIRRREDRRTVAILGGLLSILLAVWTLQFIPILEDALRAATYTFRWYVVAPVLVAGAASAGMLRRGVPGQRPIVITAFALAFLNAALVFGGSASQAWGFPLGPSLFVTTVLLGAPLAGLLVARRMDIGRVARGDPAGVYRLHLFARPDAETRERLRTRLGLSSRAARRIERLVAVEREAPPVAGARMIANRYRRMELLSAGTSGTTHAAWDVMDQRPVVLKRIARRIDDLAVQRELAALLLIRHPNVVHALDVVPSGDAVYLVLARVEGETLRERLALSWSSAQIADMVADLAAGVAELHSRGIVHCDIKPENIMLTDNGGAVLVDLGSAWNRLGGARPGGRTPRYTAPWSESSRPLPGDDMYSIGVCLEEVLESASLKHQQARRWAELARQCKEQAGPLTDGRGLARALALRRTKTAPTRPHVTIGGP